MAPRRAFCSDVSLENAESLAATASHVDHWITIEYRGLWAHDAVKASGLSDEVKRHLREQAAALGRAKVLFIRRAERRGSGDLCVFWGSSPERGARLFGARVGAYEDLLDLDFTEPGEPVGHPLLLVCTHGRHDPCCARLGRPLYDALREQTDDGWVWQCSHLGGDRFAGNLLCLPEGLYFGRVGAAESWAVLDAYLGGRIQLDLYRGRSCYPFAVQAAERAVRERSGLVGLDDVTLTSREPLCFRADERLYEVEVVRADGELTYLTCGADSLRRPRLYAARILRESAV
jgi:hypothetical protein